MYIYNGIDTQKKQFKKVQVIVSLNSRQDNTYAIKLSFNIVTSMKKYLHLI